MIRYLTRWTVLLTLLFVLPVALIRAQPYNDSDLRAFLTPPAGCPAPCFMGIRTGVTTADEAVAILESHEWIRATQEYYEEIVLTDLVLEWKPSSPGWLDKAGNGRLGFEQGVVESIVIATRLGLGDVLLILGNPDNEQVVSYQDGATRILAYITSYNNFGVTVSIFEACPVRWPYLSISVVSYENIQQAQKSNITRPSCPK